jgi:Tfp pilus assembly protein PilF
VRRWELDRGLPVHRLPGTARGAVYAFTNELEEWLLHKQSQSGGITDSDPRQAVPGPVALPDPKRVHLGENDVVDLRLQTMAPSGPVRTIQRVHWPTHLPWLITVALAAGVFTGIYFYRHTARFAARADERETARHFPNPEAQDFYLQGRYYWSKRTPEDLNKAVDYFTRAIVKDPGYAQAFMGLADCYNLLREFSAMPPEEAYPRALAAAQKAVELDDSSAEAHNSLAFATFYWNWDPGTAEREFKRTIELNPNYVQGHHWYATFLMARRRFPEALDQIEQARQLDPSSTAVLADRGFILWHAGQIDEAFAQLKQLETTDTSLASPHAYLARMYLEQGEYTASFAESKRAALLKKDKGALAVAEAAERGFAAGGTQGMYEEMLPVREKLYADGSGSAYDVAVACAALGKNEEAIHYLKAAFEKREVLVMFLSDPAKFPTLNDDPAYQQLVAKVEQRLAQTASR